LSGTPRAKASAEPACTTTSIGPASSWARAIEVSSVATSVIRRLDPLHDGDDLVASRSSIRVMVQCKVSL